MLHLNRCHTHIHHHESKCHSTVTKKKKAAKSLPLATPTHRITSDREIHHPPPSTAWGAVNFLHLHCVLHAVMHAKKKPTAQHFDYFPYKTMLFDTETNSSASIMSNYSVYFLLQNNGLDLNCSVYSLTLGLIVYYNYYDYSSLGNITEFLPAYYVTNCSIKELKQQIKHQNLSAVDVLEWVDDFRRNPYNVSDNGDSFVALLFTILGLCVSCWMLMLLFLLLPKHKRKPLLTLIATFFYLVVLTVILSKITDVAREEYYSDSLDMIRILGIVNERHPYSVVLIISHFLTNLAVVQLVIKLTLPRWKRPNTYLGIAIIIGYLIFSIIEQVQLTDYFTYVSTASSATLSTKIAVRLLLIIWFSIALAYYTIWGTASNPRQVSYSKKLMPLAVLTWLMIATHFVLTMLMATLWRDKWLVTSWIAFIPYLLDMFTLTCSWEWYYSIRDLELKLELVGMLGRPISLDDVMEFSNSNPTKRDTFRGRFELLKDFFFGRTAKPVVPYGKDIPSLATGSDSTTDVTHTHTPSAAIQEEDEEIDLGDGIPMTELAVENLGNEVQTETNALLTRSIYEDDDDDENYSYEVEYLDDDEMWNDDDDADGNTGIADSSPHNNNGNLAGRDDLPSFRAHPGFHADDYWDDK